MYIWLKYYLHLKFIIRSRHLHTSTRLPPGQLLHHQGRVQRRLDFTVLCLEMSVKGRKEHFVGADPTIIISGTFLMMMLEGCDSKNSILGKNNCIWSSCREGCTKEVYTCWQVRHVGLLATIGIQGYN